MSKEFTVRDEVRLRLSQRLEHARSLDDVRDLFAEVLAVRDVVGHGHSVNLANSLCEAAASATRSAPEQVAEIVEFDVLPFVVLEEDDSESSPRLSIDQQYLRENIRNWVYQFPHSVMFEVRNDVLRALEERIRTCPLKPYFWCVASLGYRTQSLNTLLWEIAKSDGAHAETAASVLISTGLSIDEHSAILDLAETQIEQNGGTHLARVTIQELVGPDRPEIAIKFLKSSFAGENEEKEKGLGRSLAVSVATRAVDRCSDHDPIHDLAWSLLREHPKEVSQSHEYSFRCNSASVIEDHFCWLAEVDGDDQANSHHWTYIYLMRLAELVKPAHLVGWRNIENEVVLKQLSSIVASSSGHRGQWATTTSKLKPDALETLLEIGFLPTSEFIEKSVVDESSGFVASDIARLLACTSVGQLPSPLLDLVRSGHQSDDEDNQHFFRHTGLIALVQSSRSRTAFDAISQFGFVYQDDVLLATVDAIAETAIARIEQGDSDIPETLLELVSKGDAEHQREAAASVFCRLVLTGYVRGKLFDRLIDLVDDESLKPFTRGEALEAIARTQFSSAEQWRDRIWSYTRSPDEPLHWRAMEVFIRRDWLDADKEIWLLDRLGLSSSSEIVKLSQPESIVGWQAYLLGLMYALNVRKYSHAMASAFERAKPDVFYQLIRPVSRAGKLNANNVVDSFARRVLFLNTEYSTDTGLFLVLAKLSPYSLLEIVESNQWQRWMVEGKAALCDATYVALSAIKEDKVKEYLISFMQDSAFQVRRSAYRVLSQLDHEQLFSICQLWTDTDNVELERRAAELVEWLPRDHYPDGFVGKLGFQSHREPAVRDAFQDVLIRRRQRAWADQYLEELFVLCRNQNPDTAECFRLVRALGKFGDDDTIRRIKQFVSREPCPIWIRTLLKRATKQIEKQWKKTTEKWSEPWSHEAGDIEEVDGKFVLSDGSEISAKILLWRQHRFDQSEKYAWGGLAVDLSGRLGFWHDDREVTLAIHGRENSRVLVGNVRSKSRIGTEIRFNGQSEYPGRDRVTDHPKLMFNQVLGVLQEAELALSKQEAAQIAERLQPAIEGSDLATRLVSPDDRVSSNLRTPIVVLIVRVVADVLRDRDPYCLSIWTLADRLLATDSQRLRFSPSDLTEFSNLVFDKNESAEDELVVWIRDRLAPASHPADVPQPKE
ncbi:hypothetical protein Enr13x_23310 [Stieleria neptunia]|uniref:Uncharacterized protein n=1 Tax=Stieleria neptunia TaxID=2527979 RepID=A0A518HNR1_9BACT|nr:hypothetical protein [Stieleria neptunia]QDV42483.1 hypothetical protein Enr13x_23310 [Stieleria neptunia]